MKVLYAIESLGGGGTERSLAELLPRLAAAGVEPMVVCLATGGEIAEVLEAAGIPVQVLASTGWPGRIAGMRRAIARARPDLVHTALFRTDVLGRLGAAGRRVPVLGSLVSTPYAPVRFRDPSLDPRRLRLVRLADQVTARLLCDHFQAVSESAKRAAVRDLGVRPERITVVPRGRDPERLGRPSEERRRRARAALGLAERDEVIVNVGRHEYAKGQLDLVAAVSALAAERPALRLLIAGREGALSGELRAAVETAGLGDRVRLLGHRNDLPEILAAADLFAFPSLYEGLPGAVIEAMALGLPVIGSDIGPVREVVDAGGSAELVPTASPRRLAAAIDGMLTDRRRAAALGRRGREIFEERFTLERSVQKTLDLYRRLAAGGA